MLVHPLFFPKFNLFFQAQRKVAVVGASGGIGQPLSLLLKNSPLVTQLSLYDIVHTPGVAADLSHIESKAAVKGFVGPDQLEVRKSSIELQINVVGGNVFNMLVMGLF